MGAGVLPTTIHNNKIYFLFGKENKFADTPGWSDFGGGTEKKESFLNTAIREAGEELTGFLGSPQQIRELLTKHGTYNIDIPSKSSIYRMHIVSVPYDESLPYYYNNNQKFLQSHLDENIIKNTKIFEKAEIRWIPIDKLLFMKNSFRSYFQSVIILLLQQQDRIKDFLLKTLGNSKMNFQNLYSSPIYTMRSSRKGTSSKTHPGRKNYTTKKGDKVFHRKGKYVRLSRRPYGKKRTVRRH